MLDRLNYAEPDLEHRYWLFCGDDWLEWKAPTEVNIYDNDVPKRTVGSLNNGRRCPLSTPLIARHVLAG